jgi:ATP-dependent DNA helicase RecQ
MQNKALSYLRTALGRADITFRPGQWDSIEAILNRQRLLVVERTGWGKSMIYFLATRLLRDEGAGPTLLVSPLLSLMRNQLEAAARLGIRAETINSSNEERWPAIARKIREDALDVLIVSPERLGNPGFQASVLSALQGRIGLFVVDEAHCISDWGHDFRPDYRRIVQVLRELPADTPVLATTATANNRVVADILSQLGQEIRLIRGPLIRESLKLQTLILRSPAARMAWLAKTIPSLPGSGIVYTLTQRDAERLAEWLTLSGISAKAYHSGLGTGENGALLRDELEQQLLKNEIKALVATVALGMGFDKPDLGFVIHYQHPASVVHYYQQVGRAGRALESAYGILLAGEEDDSIADFFIERAFPPRAHVENVLKAMTGRKGAVSMRELGDRLNLKRTQVEKTLKFLSVETPPAVAKTGTGWITTASGATYRLNEAYVNAITAIRRQEQAQMRAYLYHSGCLMEFLARALDDPHARPCGQCARCRNAPLLDPAYSVNVASKAQRFLDDKEGPRIASSQDRLTEAAI